MNIEECIRILEDREMLRELRATYCFLVDDDRYTELVRNHFTSDARCDLGFRSAGLDPFISNGHDEILNFFQNFVGIILKDMSHTTHNHRIVVDGDHASGDCYFELTTRDGNGSSPVVGTGRYFDEFERVDDA
jgi:hypothetical protein